MSTPPGQPVLDLTIELREVEPRVWRRLLVPGSVRLDKLHRMFQAAMGWEDCHLHSFEIGGDSYGMQFDDYPDDVGGSWGYEHLLAVLADPSHEEHEHLSRWVGRPVDPHEFDLALVNAHLQASR